MAIFLINRNPTSLLTASPISYAPRLTLLVSQITGATVTAGRFGMVWYSRV